MATRILLIGAGHTHLLALKELRERDAALSVTLVTDTPKPLYSGMAPGCIAGAWPRSALELDPRRFLLPQDTFLLGHAEQIDRKARRIHLEDGTRLDYDLLSINVGATPDPAPSDWARTLKVKPLGGFIDRLETLFAQDPPQSALILGAGAAGVEIAFALRARGVARVTLLDKRELLGNGPPALRARVQRKLARLDVTVLERVSAVLGDGHVTLPDGAKLTADLLVLATGGRPAAWLRRSDLPVESDGSLATRDTLQLVDDERVFAVGDCARLRGAVYAKAGVHAVRQAPVLAHNLIAQAQGRALTHWRPRRHVLSLINSCDGAAFAARNGLSAEGRWVSLLKTRIDRSFVASLA